MSPERVWDDETPERLRAMLALSNEAILFQLSAEPLKLLRSIAHKSSTSPDVP